MSRQSPKIPEPRPAEFRSFINHVIARRRFRQRRGTLPSEKMRRPVSWTTESQRDAMLLLEMHHGVVTYKAWPDAVDMLVGSDVVAYPPSIAARLADGRTLFIDLVHREDVGSPERCMLDRQLAAALRERGGALVVMSEPQLRADPRLPNARAVMRASGWPLRDGAVSDCDRIMRERGGPVSLGELAAAADGDPVLRGTACVLAMRRVLAIDLRAPAPDACTVRLPVGRAA